MNTKEIKFRKRKKVLYHEYTAFRNEVIKHFVEKILPDSKVLFDPMAGTAPLIPYVNYLNLKAYFNDINPLHFYINKAKTFMINKTVKNILSGSSDYLFKEMSFRLRKLKRKSLVFSNKWIPDEILEDFKIAWNEFNEYEENICVFFKAVTLLCIRPFSSISQSEKNSLWYRPGGMTTKRDLVSIIRINIDRYLSFYEYYYSNNVLNKTGKYFFSVEDASSLKLKNRVDTIITSPPFPNRFDFTVTYGPELYFLSEVGSGPEINLLKKEILASNVVTDYSSFDNDLLAISEISPKTYNFLIEIRDKQLKTENDYYLRYYLKYYLNLYKILDKLIKILTDDGTLYIVVQNNIHRGELNNMEEFIKEYFQIKDFKVSRDYWKSRSHQGKRNISADYPLVLKKHLEVILKISR